VHAEPLQAEPAHAGAGAEAPLPTATPLPAEPVVAEALPETEPEAMPEPTFAAEPPAVYEEPAHETPGAEPVPLPQPPAPRPAPYPPAAVEPQPAPQAPEAPPAAAATWRMTIRLTNGERVEAGDFPDQAAAKLEARTIMVQVADADSDEWPFVNGRFLKPDTIVSVDIAELAGDES
jgi:hypothetical protein